MEIENLCDEKALPGDDSETSESPENKNSNEEKESLYDEEGNEPKWQRTRFFRI